MASAPFNTTIDNLVYSYGPTNKNELRRVADGTNAQGFKNGSNTDDDYAYDANGNLTIDKNKGITGISYNQLNLPVKIEFGTNKIEYLYNATGQKVQKKVTQGSTITTTDYLGGYQYNNNVLEYFPHAEGYVKRETSGTYNYVFNYTDHLGNVRISYSDTNKNGIVDKSNNEILEESNYYPFGLKHEGYNTNNYQANYKYKYNGKELQDELGLNMYDYGARNYDPALGRWMNIDPHSENYLSVSNYVAFANNPISYTDPTGKDILFWQLNHETDEYEQVKFNQLDKKVQAGILNFLGTKAGKHFFAKFAKAGDRIGKYKFVQNGSASKHKLMFRQIEGNENDEGVTQDPRIGPNYMTFQIDINKDMDSPDVNVAETIGHEVFLHLYDDAMKLIELYKNDGTIRDAFKYVIDEKRGNPSGYIDHLAVKNDINGLAKRYYEYISQLKSVLNPVEVQKHVSGEIKKTYNAGVRDTPQK